MTEPLGLKRVWVDAIHFQQLLRFGGLYGVRDDGVIDSALARPLNRWAHENQSDLAALAAAYGYGLTRGHGYLDGNKRVGFVAMAIFLDLNGWSVEAPEPDVVQVMVAVAAGEMSEDALAAWLHRHMAAAGGEPD